MMRLLGNILVVDPLPLLSDLRKPAPRVDLKRFAARPSLTMIDLFGAFLASVRTFAFQEPPELNDLGGS